jgi:hypothetical protein
MHSRCVKHMQCQCLWCHAQVLVTVTPGVLHKSLWLARIRAHGSSAARFSGLGIFLVHCTIRFSFSQPDRATCREICSQFHVVTRPALCVKVVALWSSYNLAIATIAKKLLDHSRIPAQRLPNFTVIQYSVSALSDSQTSDPFNS